jgi:hypothetical protein
MAVYYLVDRVIPYLVKLTFPLWVLPFLCCLFIYKTFNLWRNIFNFLFSLVSPQTSPELVFALVKGNGRYLRKNC